MIGDFQPYRSKKLLSGSTTAATAFCPKNKRLFLILDREKRKGEVTDDTKMRVVNQGQMVEKCEKNVTLQPNDKDYSIYRPWVLPDNGHSDALCVPRSPLV